MNLTIKEEATKLKCERSLLAFTRYIYKEYTGRKFQVSEHFLKIADALEKCARGEITRLIINIPPRYGKTELAVKMFIPWVYANKSSANFIHLSYDKGLALDNSNDAKEYIKSPAFQKFWPMEIKKSSDAKGAWETDGNGKVHAGSAGGAVTGFGAGITDDPDLKPEDHHFSGAMIIDDPLKPDDASYDVKRKAVNNRYNTTLISRVNSDKYTPIILIMQRIHMEDMAGYLLGGGSGEEWYHVNMQAIKEDGTPLWPNKHSIERLEQIEKANKYVFSAQYMQNPIPLDDGLFKTDKLKIVPIAPGNIVEIVRYWDKAGTADGGAFTAGVKIGRTADGQTVIMNAIRGQWSALTRENTIKQTADIDGPITQTWIEQEPGSGGKESSESTKRNLAGHIIYSERPTGDKVTRAVPFACQVEAGNVIIVAGEWNKDYIEELRYFPLGKYKDQVDGSSGAFNKLFDGGFDLFALNAA